MTFALGGHFGEDVALVSAFALPAARCLLEALGGATVGLHLAHFGYYSAFISHHWRYSLDKRRLDRCQAFFFFVGARTITI